MGRDKVDGAAQQDEEQTEVHQQQRPRQSYGTVAWEAGKSRVEPDTLAYLTEVAAHVGSVEDGEELELLLANVLEELGGKELQVAADAAGSRLLEALLARARPAHLVAFMGAFTSEDVMYKLAGRCGRRGAALQGRTRDAGALRHLPTLPEASTHPHNIRANT